MKTLTNLFFNLFSTTNHLAQCSNITGKSLPLQQGCYSQGERTKSTEIISSSESENYENSKSEKPERLRKLKTHLHALADRVRVVANKATWKSCVRVLIGIGLYGIAAPLAEVAYTWLDKNDRVPREVWYYESMFFLFLCLGPSFDKIFSWLGGYFIFVHKKNKLKSYLIAFPLGTATGKIIWLLQVTSDEEFHSITPWQFIMYGIALAVFFLFAMEKLVWFKHHRIDSIEPRENGLKQIAYAIPAEKFRDSVMETWEKKEEIKQYQF